MTSSPAPSKWRAVEILAIGGDYGNGVEITHVRHATIDSTGRIYVLPLVRQSGDPPRRILVFSPEGTLLRRIEFRGKPIRSMHYHNASGLLVRLEDEYVFMDTQGHIVTSAPASVSTNVPPYVPGLDSGGGIIEYSARFDVLSRARGMFTVQPMRVRLGLGDVEYLPPMTLSLNLIPGTPIPPPMNSRLLFAQDGDALWVGASADYRIVRRTLAGDTTSSVSLTVMPALISQERKRRLAQEWSSNYDVDPDDVPDAEPILQRIVVDNRGRLLVFPRVSGIPAGAVIDVFHGVHYEGRINLPYALNVLHHAPVVLDRLIVGTKTVGSDRHNVVILKIIDEAETH